MQDRGTARFSPVNNRWPVNLGFGPPAARSVPRGLRLQTRRPDRGLAEDFATPPRPIWPCGPGVEKWLEPGVISPRIIDRNRRTRVMNVTEPSWWDLPSDPCKPSVLLSRTSIRIIAAVILTLLYCPSLNLMKTTKSQFDERGAKI